MAKSQPYQPFPLRVLHGSIAALVILALFTGFLIYNVYDGRIGQLPIPTVPRIMGIHKLFGRLFLFIIPVFALYSFHAGRRRLWQEDSLKKLQDVGKPIWWYTLHRLVNSFLLLAAVFALVSGRQMDEGWMRSGDLTQVWYTLHLGSWVVMALSLICHLLMSFKVGGLPLLLSILSLKNRPGDTPAAWIRKFKSWVRHPQL